MVCLFKWQILLVYELNIKANTEVLNWKSLKALDKQYNKKIQQNFDYSQNCILFDCTNHLEKEILFQFRAAEN